MSYSSEILADSPLLYWRLNETSGDAQDSSGNGRTGAWGSAITYGEPGLLVGDSDKAAGFGGGSTTTARIQADPAAWMMVSAFTVSAMIKLTSVSGVGIGMVAARRSGSQSSGNSWSLNANNADLQCRVYVSDSTTTLVTVPDVLSAGVATHVAASFDGSTIRVYVDGVQVGSGSLSGSMQTGIRAFTVGNDAGTANQRFAGTIDEVAYFGSALSAARIEAQSLAAAGGPSPTVIDLGLAARAATALAVTAAVGAVVPLGVAERTSEALPITVQSGQIVALGTATRTSEALPLAVTAGAQVGLGVAARTATALPVAVQDSSTGVVINLGVAERSTLALPLVADPGYAPGDTSNAADGIILDGTATTSFVPAIAELPRGFFPQQYVADVAEAFSAVTMNGATPVYDVTRKAEARPRQRITFDGVDRSFFRGVPVVVEEYQYLQPFLYGPATLSFPQIRPIFEEVGAGDLSWLRKGVYVRIESVDDEAGTVLSVDYKGRIEKWHPREGILRVELGGEVRGPAATKYKPNSPIPWRHDMGRLVHRMLNNLGVTARPRRGPETGFVLGEPGGSYMLPLLEEMFAQAWTRDGDQWTCLPDDDGIYRTRVKDRTTCHATIYADDAHVVVDLSSDVAEEPNRVFGTGTNPDGMRINNAIFGGAIEPDKVPAFPGVMSEFSWGSEGLDVLLHKLRTQRYLNANEFPGGFDDDVVDAVKQLQEDAGLPETGVVDLATWKALWDIDVTGRSVRGTRIEPLAQRGYTREWFHSAGGAFTGKNPNYDPTRQVVDIHYDFGAKQRRNQMVKRARGVLSGVEEQWSGTITINTGAVVAGDHTPGDPITSIMRANQIRPGMNVKIPLMLGDRLLHVTGASVSGRTVTLMVDTKARDTVAAYQAWQANLESRRDPARAWLREYRSSNQVKDTLGEWSEAGGLNDRKRELVPNDWIVFDIFTGPIEGQIKWLKMNCGPGVEFAVLVFGMKMNAARIRNLIPNPLSKAGEARFRDRDIRRKLKQRVLLYSAGIEEEPCGYWPDKKTEGASIITGKWEDDQPWPYRTIPPLTSEIYTGDEEPTPEPLNRFPEPVLYVCVYANAPGYVRPGRILWPAAEGGV